jgi:hypothetical protein
MRNKSKLLQLTPAGFIGFLKKEDIKKFFIVYDDANKTLTASHLQLQFKPDFFLADERDFIEHEGWF